MAAWLLSFLWAEWNDRHGSFFFTILTSSAGQDRLKRLRKDIDWVGVLIASACMAMLSYIFAMVTSCTSTIRHLPDIVLLSLAVVIMPASIILGWTSGTCEPPGNHPELDMA